MRIGTTLLVVITLFGCAEGPAPPAADWVLTNGQFYTVDETRPWAEAVVIKDGEFILSLIHI